MVSNEHLCLIKSHILRESDKLCLIKTMAEDDNSQTHIAAVRHHITRRLNKDTEYSLTCGLSAYGTYSRHFHSVSGTKKRRGNPPLPL